MIMRISIAVAIVGVGVAIYAAATTTSEAPQPPLAGRPSIDPFEISVAASGVVEGRTRNVEVAAPQAGLVREVLVLVGDEVSEGDALFRLDARPLEADLLRAEATAEAAAARLALLEARPREEDLPPLRAAVDRLRAGVADAEDEYERTVEAASRNAASDREVADSRFALDSARADLAEAEANLALALDGAWERDIAVARAERDAARAETEATRLLIDRRTVRAPLAGTVLKRNVEPGEFAAPADPETPIVLADLSTLVVRAQINEEDMPAADRMLEAIARPRGRPEQRVPVALLRIEPLAIPKRQLTGAPAELVDTRVIEVLFTVEETAEPRLYPGQLVDVFIRLREAEPADADASGE